MLRIAVLTLVAFLGGQVTLVAVGAAAAARDGAFSWVRTLVALVGLVVPSPVRGFVHHDAETVPGMFRRVLRNPDLLRLDFYVFLLHAILTASFVALPFLLSERLELPMTGHWKIYVGALLVSLAITVAIAIKVVGVLLIAAMLIIPAAAARAGENQAVVDAYLGSHHDSALNLDAEI